MTKKSSTLTTGDKLLGALSYIGPLGILGFVLRPGNAYNQLHASQGLIIFVIFYLLGILGGIALPLYYLIGFMHLIVALLGIVMAIQGRSFKIPVVGDMAERLDFNQK